MAKKILSLIIVILLVLGNAGMVFAEEQGTEEGGAELIYEGKVYRIYGKDRYATSIKTAEALKEEMGIQKFSAIVVASGETFADALPGSYLAARENAPILLINRSSQNTVKEYINNNLEKDGNIYVLGGEGAVSSGWLTGLKYKRIGGVDRYSTNLAILQAAGIEAGSEIMVCTGLDFADSLSASATGNPILLVGDELTIDQKNFLQGINEETYYMIGGTGAVVSEVEAELAAYGVTDRVEGADRYTTSIEVAQTFFGQPEYAVLAFAENFPDGLSGGVMAYKIGGPMILTKTGKESAAAGYAGTVNVGAGYVLGGPTLISDDCAKIIFGAKDENFVEYDSGVVKQDQYDEMNYIDEFKFDEDITRFVFYSPHQDDETLFFSQTIEAAIEQVGAENVKVILISDGAASGAQYKSTISSPINDIINSIQDKLTNAGLSHISENEIASAKELLFSQARTNEFLAAISALGVTDYELHLLPDGELPYCGSQIEDIIRSNLGTDGKVAHLTFSYYHDEHADHRAVGTALQTVSLENGFDDNNVAYCIVKMEEDTLDGFHAQDLTYKKENFAVLKQTENSERIKAAASEYGVYCENIAEAGEIIAQAIYDVMLLSGSTMTEAIEYVPEVSMLRLGVGHLSVKGYFATLQDHLEQGTLATIIHRPF